MPCTTSPVRRSGAYWDGGITDYHMHLDYTALHDGLVLIPHFQPTLVPGWLDKPFKRRHRASARLDNVVLLVPHPEWVATLARTASCPIAATSRPTATMRRRVMRAWRVALAESARLADEFEQLVSRIVGARRPAALDSARASSFGALHPVGTGPRNTAPDTSWRARSGGPEPAGSFGRGGHIANRFEDSTMIAKSHLRARLLPVAAAVLGAVAGAAVVPSAYASSHREAPYITTRPKVDGTDFYMFRSYEGVAPDGTGGRSDYVTLIANYLPLQAPYGGPNYFSLDPDALYEIHIDNNGDSREDLTFQFRFKNNRKGIQLDIGDKNVAIPLIQAGQVADRNAPALNVNETYTVDARAR